MKYIALIVIVLLTLSAFGLAIVVYKNNLNNFSTVNKIPQQQIQQKSTTPNKVEVSDQKPLAKDQKAGYLSKLSASERAVLDLPTTSESIKNNSRLIMTVAKPTNTIDITRCETNPPVVKIKLGSNLTLKNQDSVAHKFSVGDFINSLIGANSSKDQAFNPTTGVGFYTYSCDDAFSGYIVATSSGKDL